MRKLGALLRLGSVLAGAYLFAMQAQAQVQTGAWPGGRKTAVVLTYGDSLDSQLDIALPALDAAGLKGTFFLIGSQIRPDQIGRWRAAAAAGHELGNHTVRHACPQASYPPARRLDASDSYDVEMMLAEIRAMNSMLTAIDGKLQHGLATPCGQHLAGGQDYLPALRANGLVRYTRSAEGASERAFDPMNLPCIWFDEKASGADMIAAVEKAERNGGLLIIGFHGVGGDYLKVNRGAHAQLLAYLKQNAATIWVAPLMTVMEYAVH
ncbi:polysaccharide deacetylase family protein [Sphingobium sp. CCH11-B1]|jgi:peptidoglycan/xylan/chitin deacetylase (PgdA/CDA1 family)|uniref:polysaccharide deacetylase family protein n=1 Tax=Sphingobium sp. CCH11-B1 TaxID=1768781 RepID=UPI0008353460|nr:polysaccharide deacetylase family protein [Sphingobium sp. CCH11-B1]